MSYTATATITINAPATKVWDALTIPELVKQYMFDTTVQTDWQPGSPITYSGVWEGKPYQDKGVVKEIESGKRLVTTYYSAFSGLEDKPENYSTITEELTEEDDRTTLILTQDNNPTQEAADHATQNWNMVLQGLKELLER